MNWAHLFGFLLIAPLPTLILGGALSEIVRENGKPDMGTALTVSCLLCSVVAGVLALCGWFSA